MEIMLAQMKIHYDCADTVEAFKLSKLERLKKRVLERLKQAEDWREKVAYG